MHCYGRARIAELAGVSADTTRTAIRRAHSIELVDIESTPPRGKRVIINGVTPPVNRRSDTRSAMPSRPTTLQARRPAAEWQRGDNLFRSLAEHRVYRRSLENC